MVTAQSLLQAGLNGLILGMIYVAIAIGLTIIFGMLRLVNFAHGAFYGIGAYVGLVIARAMVDLAPVAHDKIGVHVGIEVARQVGFGTALVVAPLVVAILALGLDRIVLRRFYEKEPTAQILLTFGIALIVEEALRMMFGGTTQQYPLPSWLGGSIAMAGLQYPAYRIYLAIGIALVVALVWIFITRTNFGLLVRAGIRDRTMVELLGGNVRLASSIIFALGAALAGLVGVAASPIYSIDPQKGFDFLIPSFVVVVIGGLGSFWGAVLGGIIVGELISITQLVFPPGAEVIIYIVMALVLLFRPQGLLGESEVIKG